MGGHSYSIDEELYLSATKSFVHLSSTVDLEDPGMARNLPLLNEQNGRGEHGAPFGVLVLYAPFAIAAGLLSKCFSGSTANEIYRLIFFSANSVYAALIATVLFSISRISGLNKRRAVSLSLIFGLCTYQWQYSANAFPQTLSALTTLLAFYFWCKYDENSSSKMNLYLSGFIFGLSVAVRLTNILFLPLFLLAICFRVKRDFLIRIKESIAFCLSSSALILLSGWFNWLRFGNPLATGYGKVSFDTPIYEGIFGLLFSTGKGLIFYAPISVVALLGLRKALISFPVRNTLCISIVIVQTAVYGKFEMWSGENAYGPRYLIPVLPLVCILVIPLARIGKQWLVGIWISGVVGFIFSGLMGKLMYFNAVYWNQQPGLLQDMDATSLTAKQQYLAWNFQPRSSPLILQLRAIPDLISNTFSRLGGGLGKLDQIPISYDDRIHWYARTINLDFWWAWWPAKSSNQFVYLFLAVPIALVVFGGFHLMKELRVSESLNENEI
jgi:hypothetical protein